MRFIALGALAVTTQVLLLREALVTVSGLELALGLALASWLVGGGLGSLAVAAVRSKLWAEVSLGLSCLAPVSAVLGFRAVRALWQLPPGWEWQPTQALMALALIPLLPGALLGASFSLLSRSAGSVQPYLGECLGSLVGGMALTFGCLGRVEPCTLALAAAALPTLALVGPSRRLGAAVLVGALLALPVASELEQRTASASARGLAPESVHDGRLSRLAWVRLGQQRTLYRSGCPTLTLPVPPEQLLALDAVLAQHPRPRSVLLVGAQPPAVLHEILRHQPHRLDMVEPDADYLEAVLGSVRVPRLTCHLEEVEGQWDVILLPLPGPSSLLLNRFYTEDFLRRARSRLSPGGMLAISAPGVADSLDAERGALLALLLGTVRSVFPHAVTLPMDQTWLVASNGPLVSDPTEVTARLAARGVSPLGLPPESVEAVLEVGRADWLRQELERADAGELNRVDHPLGVLWLWRAWARQGSQIDWSWLGLAAGLALPAVAGLRRRWPRGAGAPLLLVAAGGFTCMTLQVVGLYHFQARFGCLYQALGALMALSMAGLALGSWLSGPGAPRRWLEGSGLALAALALAAPWAGDARVLIMVVAGVLAGAQFPAACRLLTAEPGWVYGVDLLGSALGAGLVGSVCLPAQGVEVTCLATAVLGLGALGACRRGQPGCAG